MHPVSANVTAAFQGSLKILICAEWEHYISCHCAAAVGKKKYKKKENLLIHNFWLKRLPST